MQQARLYDISSRLAELCLQGHPGSERAESGSCHTDELAQVMFPRKAAAGGGVARSRQRPRETGATRANRMLALNNDQIKTEGAAAPSGAGRAALDWH